MTSPLFSSAAIAQMRALQEGNLPHTCQIKALQAGGREGGVLVENWANVGAAFPCRVRVKGSARERFSGDQLRGAAAYEVIVPVTIVTITRKHRLEVSGNAEGVVWSLLLQVEGPLGPKLAQPMRRYLCVPVSGDGA